MLARQKAKFVHNEIIPFEHINGIVPGVTSIEAVGRFFGEADSPLMYVDEGSVTYRRYGLAMGVKGSTVVWVTAGSPFRGKSPSGLYLGLDAAAARKI